MDVAGLRAETPGCAHRVHLNNAGAALLSRSTLDAMTAYLRLESEIGGYEAADRAAEEIEDVYAAAAELVGGRPEEIAMVESATHAWNAAFYAIPLGRGDRVLTSVAEYGSNVLAYLQVAARTGAEIVVVPDDDRGQLDVAQLRDLVDERTRVIGVSHVPTSGGLVQPAAEIGRIARDAGALFLLDATQSVGQIPVDVEALRCDLLTATGRKFLGGPRGTGFLWVRDQVLDRLEPHVVDIRAGEWDGARSFSWSAGARRFETWESSYVNVVGLRSAIRQALDLGIERIGERIVALGARLRGGLAAQPGVTTFDNGAERCGIVTASVDGCAAEDVAAALGGQGINVSTTVAAHNQFDTEKRGVHPLVRLSPHVFTTEEEIDRTIAAVAGLA